MQTRSGATATRWLVTLVRSLALCAAALRMAALCMAALCITAHPASAADPDGDGLETWRELNLGSDPYDADSDDDGVDDGTEFFWPEAGWQSVPVRNRMDSTSDARAADLDGDGDNDLIVTSNTDLALLWYENTDGLATFSAARILATHPDLIRSPYPVDIDGDGDVDIVCVEGANLTLAWWENTDGLGHFRRSARWAAPPVYVASAFFAVDLDADGDRDIVSRASSGYTLRWSENLDGRGTFAPSVQIVGAPYNMTAVDFADVDGDGAPDLLLTGPSTSPQSVGWMRNNVAQGTFGPYTVVSTAVVDPAGLVGKDIDYDGDVDLVSISTGDSKVAWYRNTNGLGAFGPQLILSTAVTGATQVIVTNLESDLDNDILIRTSDNKINWFRNNFGTGTFGPKLVVPSTNSGMNSLVAAKLNGDAYPDLITSSFGDNKLSWHFGTNTTVGFGPQITMKDDIESATGVAMGDIDGDGDLDVAMSTAQIVPDYRIVWSKHLSAQGSFVGRRPIGTATDPNARGLALGDIDGDADLDVVAATNTDVVWYENTDGTGTFGPRRSIVASFSSGNGVAAHDMDGDGDIDVVAFSDSDRKVTWYENIDSAGAFGPARIVADRSGATGIQLRDIRVADLDADGDPDVLVGASDGPAVYENLDGLGSFGLATQVYNAGLAADDVDVADFDHDGVLDLLSATQGAKVSWNPNWGGNWVYGPERLIVQTVGQTTSSHTVATDIDGDGSADVVFSGQVHGDRILWSQNVDGLGTFGPPRLIHRMYNFTYGSVYALGADDLDADGSSDVLVSYTGRIIAHERGTHMSMTNPDSDGDGLLDGFEVAYRFDPAVPSVPGLNPVVFDEPLFDPDGDGLSQLAEQAAGTHPFMADTDADGLNDGFEVAAGLDPLVFDDDADGDGVTNAIEVAQSTNPLAADTDGDGLSDLIEFRDTGTRWRRIPIDTQFVGLLDVPIASTDVDGDGDLDVFAIDSSKTIYWFENLDSAGAFAPRRVVATSAASPFAVSLGDLDGDGDADLVVSYPSTKAIVWYENADGAGTFGPAIMIDSTRTNPTELVLADIDGDGDLDIVSIALLHVGWFENLDGQGNFGAIRTIETPTSTPTHIVVADMDGDGDLDVVRTLNVYSSGSIAWYPNLDGLGTFGARTGSDYAYSDSKYLIAADLDGDGDPDLAYARQSKAPIYLFSNTDGAGSLASSPPLNTLSNYPVGLAAADFDGDGDLDLIAGSFYDGLIALHENLDGSGTFGPLNRLYIQSLSPGNLGVADIVTDGHPDILARFGALERLDLFVRDTDPRIADSDGDGLLDGFEAENGFDAVYTDESAEDPDLDGLDNLAEQSLGTNPRLADTDGDGFSDLEEVLAGSDPLDPESTPAILVPSLDATGMLLLGLALMLAVAWVMVLSPARRS